MKRIKKQNERQHLLAFMICLCLLIMPGCFYVHVTHLSKKDLLWMTGFTPGKKVLFKSATDSLDFDTLDYTHKNLHNSAELFYFSSNKGFFETYEATAYYCYTVRHHGSDLDGLFGIEKKVNEDSLWGSFSFAGLESTNVADFVKLNPQDFEIEGLKISDCIIADSSNCGYDIYKPDNPEMCASKFVISKQYGLIYRAGA